MEEYLKNVHARNYTGTDDDMPDSFEAYLVNLDVDEWIKLADEYVEYIQSDMVTRVMNVVAGVLQEKGSTIEESIAFINKVYKGLSKLEK